MKILSFIILSFSILAFAFYPNVASAQSAGDKCKYFGNTFISPHWINLYCISNGQHEPVKMIKKFSTNSGYDEGGNILCSSACKVDGQVHRCSWNYPAKWGSSGHLDNVTVSIPGKLCNTVGYSY